MSTASRSIVTSFPDTHRSSEILVSTTGAARDIRKNMGNADYSYAFVLKALAPILEQVAPWRIVDRPESRLVYQAARARREGKQPVHLCLQPPQNSYLTPAVPSVIFPFWEFPQIPDREFEYDTRQNWLRILDHCDLVLAACRFTADAFRRAGVRAPVAVVPVPLPESSFNVPDWNPNWTFELDCRHLVLGGSKAEAEPSEAAGALDRPRPPLWKRVVSRTYRKLNALYKRHVLRWLSQEAAEGLFQIKNKILRKVSVGPTLTPSSTLRLDGLVFTSIFNLGDRRKNIDDMLSAFLIAFRNRPDATLVLKLATNPDREFYELKELRHRYERLNIEHDCRVVVIPDYLTDEQMAHLIRATTYYVNTSRAEGACLPLQEALAGGRPAVVPRHTALEDYIDEEVALVVGSQPEPTFFPHDPAPRFETSWHRLNWQDLHDRMLEADRIARTDPARYRSLSDAARRRMRSLYSRDASREAFREALNRIPEASYHRDLSWPA